MKKLFTILLFLFQNKFTAQTTLAPGDMSFIGFNTSGTDGVSFVTFVNLCPGTVFFFTDNPYRNSGGFCTSGEEFCIRFQVTAMIPAGTKITYTDANHPTVGTVALSPAVGTATAAYNSTGTAGTNNGFNAGGDNCFIFQGSFAAPSFVCAFKNSGTFNASGTVSCGDRNHTELPSTLTLGQNAMVGCINDGMRYNCTTVTGSAATLGAAINNISNWTCSGSAVALPPTCSFSVTGVPNPLPVITATASPMVICNGSSVNLSAGGATNYTWSANAGSATTQTTSVSPTSNITYTLTGGTLGCTATRTISVNVNPLPSLTITATPSTICSGLSTTLTSIGASSYTWSSNAGSATTSTAAVTPTASTIYTVIGTSLGCASSRTISINVTAAPSLTIASASSNICNGQSTTLMGNGASSYTWSSNAGSVTTSTAVVTPTSNTTYTVTGNTSGCTSTGIVSVNVTALPSLTLSSTSSSICSGQSATLTATGATNYTWSSNAGSVTTSTAAVIPTANTIYTVIGTNAGCSSTRTISINITALPTLSLSTAASSICLGQNTTLTATGASNYTWSANAGSVTTSTAIVTPTNNSTYTVTANNAGCVSTGTILVSVTTPPSLTVTAASSIICSGQSTILSAIGATTYTWSANAGGANTSSVSVSPNSATNYTVTGDNSGCTSLQIINVNVNTTPTVNIAATNSTVCEGKSTTLTFSGANTYTVTSPFVISNSSVIVTPTTQTTYTVFGETAGCPSNPQTITINVNTLPQIAVANQTTCAGSTATLSANGTDTYTWLPSGATTNAMTVSPAISTTYSVTGTNALTGCTSALTTVNVLVNALPTVTANANSNLVCLNSSVTLNAFTTANTFTWTLGNGINSGNQNQANVTFSASTLIPGVYVYTLIATSSQNCVSLPVTTSITVVDLPNATFNLSDLSICQNQSGTLNINNSQSGVTYDWNIGGVNIPNTNPLSIPNSVISTVGTVTVSVTATMGTCTNTANNTLTITALPIVALINANVSACENASAQLEIIDPNSTYTYNWLYNGQSLSNNTNLIVNSLGDSNSGTYIVMATDINGCTNGTTGKVDIQPCETFVPEIFTPNGDGMNDGFEIKNIENYPNNTLKIFNRWGNMVYQKDRYLNEFEGFANTGDAAGQAKLPVGTYYVILNYGDDKTENYNGYLLLQY